MRVEGTRQRGSGSETCEVAGPLERAIEVKLAQVAAESVRLDGVFEGYASLFNTEDLGRDIVLPGAFRDSLRQRSAKGIRMLFQHDPNQPIGTWEKLHEDARGLYCRGRLELGVARARDVLALLRAGAVDGLSIGFRAEGGERNRRTGVRRLSRIDLWEISIVTFPMLPQARVERIKGEARPTRAAVIGAAAREARPGAPGWESLLAERIERATRLIRTSI